MWELDPHKYFKEFNLVTKICIIPCSKLAFHTLFIYSLQQICEIDINSLFTLDAKTLYHNSFKRLSQY